jgi:hypothetical protein
MGWPVWDWRDRPGYFAPDPAFPLVVLVSARDDREGWRAYERAKREMHLSTGRATGRASRARKRGDAAPASPKEPAAPPPLAHTNPKPKRKASAKAARNSRRGFS